MNHLIDQKVREITAIYPWYKDIMNGEFNGDLDTLPFITADLLERYYYLNPMDEAFAIYHTSGTSLKKRKTISYSKGDEERYLNQKTAIFRSFIDRHNTPLVSALIDMGTGHAERTAADIFNQLSIRNESLPFTVPVSEHINKIVSFKPDILYTMPSILDGLIMNKPYNIDFGLKKIILTGEVASQKWIEKVAASLRIEKEDIFDTYGCIELGVVAYYSAELDRYVIADGFYAEAVAAENLPDDLNPLNENEKILVITSFIRDLFPALRYVTYDVVRDFETVLLEGRIVQSFKCVVKRVGSELKHGEKISIYDIENVVYKHIDQAIIKVGVIDNRLKVDIICELTDMVILKQIDEDIQNTIPDICTMINNNLLDKIEVQFINDGNYLANNNDIKKKKIYYK